MNLERNLTAANMMANELYVEAIDVYIELLTELLSLAYENELSGGQDVYFDILVETIPSDPGRLTESSPIPDDKEFPLYANTIVMLAYHAPGVLQPTQLYRDLSALAGIYNMALANHLRALRSAESQQDIARKALHLYEMALSLSESFLPRFANSFVQLVTLNNIGHICSSFFYDRERMHTCVLRMARSLDSMYRNLETNSSDDILRFHQMVAFFAKDFLISAPAA